MRQLLAVVRLSRILERGHLLGVEFCCPLLLPQKRAYTRKKEKRKNTNKANWRKQQRQMALLLADWLTDSNPIFFQHLLLQIKKGTKKWKGKGRPKNFHFKSATRQSATVSSGGRTDDCSQPAEVGKRSGKGRFCGVEGSWSCYKFVIIYWLRCAMFLSLWEWVKCWAASGKFVCVIVDITFLSNYIRFF